MKRRTITAAEHDIVNRKWRRLLCYTSHAGVVSGIKRGMRRRERREGKRELARPLDDSGVASS